MFEIPTNSTVEAAFQSAHAERAQVFAAAISFLSRPFRWRDRPQGAARRGLMHPHARPAGL